MDADACNAAVPWPYSGQNLFRNPREPNNSDSQGVPLFECVMSSPVQQFQAATTACGDRCLLVASGSQYAIKACCLCLWARFGCRSAGRQELHIFPRLALHCKATTRWYRTGRRCRRSAPCVGTLPRASCSEVYDIVTRVFHRKEGLGLGFYEGASLHQRHERLLSAEYIGPGAVILC